MVDGGQPGNPDFTPVLDGRFTPILDGRFTPVLDGRFTPVLDGHVPALARIYNHYVEHSDWAFNTEPVDETGMRRRLRFDDPRNAAFTILVDGTIAGFVAAHPFRPGTAYDQTTELSLYLAPDRAGHRLGTAAKAFIVDYARHQGFHVALGAVVAGNIAAIALATHSGFVQVGHFREIGRKGDRWLDLVWFELLLDSPECAPPPPEPRSKLS